MEQLARRIASGLTDPCQPSFCAACVLRLSYVFNSGDTKVNLRTLRTSHHNFYNRIMIFVTTERPEEDRASLEGNLRATVLSCAHRSSHNPESEKGILATARLLEATTLSLIHFIHDCLCDSMRMVKTQAFSRHGLWPSSKEDILPRGPGPSCGMLVHWFAKLPDANVFRTFCSIFLICDEMQGALLEEDRRTRFVRAVCGHLDYAVEDHMRFPEQTMNDDSQAAFSRLQDLTILLQSLKLKADLEALIRGLENRLLGSLDRAMDVLGELGEEDMKHRLASVALIVHGIAGTPFPDIPASLRLNALEEALQLGDIFGGAQALIQTSAELRICAAPNCSRPEHELGKKLLVCSSCKVVRYCSRECQKEHWSKGLRPHKLVCSRIKNILAVTSIDAEPSAFAAACRAANIGADDLGVINDGLNNRVNGEGVDKPRSIARVMKDAILEDEEHRALADKIKQRLLRDFGPRAR
ncbi:hypothetical protein EXIGLDRAFT_718031 [Exidia glandulosa HHB12029]|uniref:MYND-type domain-containing protein n=1 Tax=Exidia glandulosa HHB12029 TaxID=1314781 RepID=A0A165I141_EXIGL|nr:hypothetical protein EXIGLDRAFT_718031 [Exidia glandulosa HHB12029]